MANFCTTPLWDLNSTWHTDDPYFTKCFEDTVLVLLPIAFLLIFGLIDVISVIGSVEIKKISLGSLTILTTTKCFINFALICIYITQTLIVAIEETNLTVLDILSPALDMVGYVAILVLFLLTYWRKINNSGVQFFFWLLSVLTNGILFRTALAQSEKLNFSLPRLIAFPLICIRFILEWFNERSFGAKIDCDKSDVNPNPDKSSSYFSKLLFCWYDKLALTGYRRTLTTNDLWDLNPNDKSNLQFLKFLNYWTGKKNNTSGTGQQRYTGLGGIFLPIVKLHAFKYIFAVFLKVAGSSLLFIQPVIVRLLVAHISSEEEASWKGYFYMIIVCVAVFTQSVMMVASDKMIQLMGMRTKAAISNAVFRKALMISNTAKTDSSVGEMLNHISVDVQKFMDFIFVHQSAQAPLIIVVSTYFLYNTLGVSAFSGIGTMILLIVITNVMAIFVGTKYQQIQMKLKDERIKLTSEALSGMKVLKLYGWEIPFQKRIEAVRKLELSPIWKFSILTSLCMVIYQCTPIAVTIATFASFVLTDPLNILTAEKVFVIINLMNILKGPMMTVPLAVAAMSQIYVSVQRLNKFFNLEELKQEVGTQNEETCEHPIVIEHGTFSWTNEGTTLRDINISIKEGELVAIVGKIGAGKSSLLSTILGELKQHEGIISTKGSFAYVAQIPWIQNATVRDNILFGDVYDHEKYNRVVGSCALESDLEILSGGDQTEIGEKGTNLSGGQKQRVSLARAAYKDSCTYLFDDPLSAVDANVGKHIFDCLIGPSGILKNKTRIFVTHSMSFLPEVDRIFVMKNGIISESGTYGDLILEQGEFAKLLQSLVEDSEKKQKISKESENSVPVEASPSKNTIASLASTSKGDSKLVTQEKSAEGGIKFRFYYDYFTSAGLILLLLSIFFVAVSSGLSGYNNIYLSYWSTEESKTDRTMEKTNEYLIGYSLIGVAQCITTLIGYVAITIVCVIATKLLHSRALHRVLRCPMSYFDTTLMGTLISRFSRDIEVMDYPLLQYLRMTFMLFLSILVTFVVICITTPIFIAVVIPLTLIYIMLQRFYVATSQQLKRLESVSRSPIYSHFSETLSGVSTIRAFCRQEAFIAESEKRIDTNQKCQYPFIISSLWISLRLELLGTFVIFFTCLFVLMSRQHLDPGDAGLSITYALMVVIHLNLLARQMSELENNVVSVERVSELTETPQENSWEIPATKPSPSWPSDGELVLDQYETRYRDGLDLVLKGISLRILPGEKIGVVGRTGAGKSSLTLALFRIIEPSGGRILIDGIDIATLGIQDLRSKITIIPQDPVLFSGTLRENLDPFHQYSDIEVWICIESAHLKDHIISLQGQLQHKVEENGENFSVGQRQLICLARALLRKTQILILDEATAAVDLKTDDLIQNTVRTEFAVSTVITIAHRLVTIMDSNRVLVLSDGVIEEFDSPENLLKNSSTLFWKMAHDAKLI